MAGINLKLDSKHRISLTKLLKTENVSSVTGSVLNNGDIILKLIPLEEQWLYKDKEALADVERGLAQNKATYLGSFAKYAK